jgi:hypothetical protein
MCKLDCPTAVESPAKHNSKIQSPTARSFSISTLLRLKWRVKRGGYDVIVEELVLVVQMKGAERL